MTHTDNSVTSSDLVLRISILELIGRSPTSEKKILSIFAPTDDKQDKLVVRRAITHLKVKKQIGYI
ncbi:MAG: hypothetical protein IH840_10370, partial [Candidatus Heimdallarchaeota archaeon]|nr:hypothetical protein [Candidatus Heimdallarchaeota archaeon]